MRQLVSTISLIAFALHVLLGCCSHHAHAGDAQGWADASIHHSCCQHKHSSDSKSKSNERPRQPDDRCHENSCVFAPGIKVELAKNPVANIAPFCAVAHIVPASLSQATASRCDLPATRAYPLRTHLLLGVLLI